MTRAHVQFLADVNGNTVTWTTIGTGILNSDGDNSISCNGDGDPAPAVIAMK